MKKKKRKKKKKREKKKKKKIDSMTHSSIIGGMRHESRGKRNEQSTHGDEG